MTAGAAVALAWSVQARASSTNDAQPYACGSAGESLLIEGVTTVDFRGERPDVRSGVSVLVQGGRIARIVDHASEIDDDVTVVDGTGLTMIPGLYDMHAHVWDQTELAAQLMHGVTTVRNLSGMPFHLRLSQQVEQGEVCGARLLTSGPILNSAGPDAQIYHQIVSTAEEARAAVRQQYQVGYRRIKVYSNLAPDAFAAASDEAAGLGMAITGHTPEGKRTFDTNGHISFELDFEKVMQVPFETVEHVESLAWHGLHGEIDPAGARSIARQLAEKGQTVTPTLIAHQNLVEVAQSGGAYAYRAGIGTMSPLARLVAGQSIARWSQEDPRRERERAEFYQAFTRMLDEEGVQIVAGSDSGIFVNVPGLSLIEEVELLAEALQSPFKAIKAATATPASVLGLAGRSGCVAASCAADLVLYRCNPLQDPRCLRQPEAVIFRGHLIDAEELRGQTGLASLANAHDNERTFANVFEGFAAQGNPITPEQLGAAIGGK
ncbi:amidohydrolase family protein [Erythrobacter mangrovi]|uniref:Amidohydrolase family protein n=1 Tax=Erythrobacter mangrovi TaxID=2739433 RepID=A0A7D3Y1B0_9SPHN|nr:amidohydrolase family protein [Erythrobacter mangrovi]QKG72332.1 amidohydrolase family protein [Erythrobacter mangrovi]